MSHQTTQLDKFKPGDRVRVCEKSLGLDLSRTHEYGIYGIRDIPADPSCEKHEHWESRIVKLDEYHVNCWNIATRCRGERGNPNHAEWPWRADSLTLIEDDATDWTKRSQFKIGMTAWAEHPKWDRAEDHLQFFGGKRYGPARLVVPHIEPGDWYLGFPWQLPMRDGIVDQVFYKVINESEFVPEGTA